MISEQKKGQQASNLNYKKNQSSLISGQLEGIIGSKKLLLPVIPQNPTLQLTSNNQSKQRNQSCTPTCKFYSGTSISNLQSIQNNGRYQNVDDLQDKSNSAFLKNLKNKNKYQNKNVNVGNNQEQKVFYNNNNNNNINIKDNMNSPQKLFFNSVKEKENNNSQKNQQSKRSSKRGGKALQKPGKKKLKITQLKSIKPTNLEEQKKIFFEKDCNYDPQFEYMQDNLNFCISEPHQKYLNLAIRILEQVKTEYGNDQNFLESQGPTMDQEETNEHFVKYIDNLGFQNKISILYQDHCVSTTTCSHNGDGTAKIIVGLPISYRRGRITGVLNHEIGTHFIRKYNNQFQKWSKKRKPYNLQPYMKIEEGLACLNTHLEQSWDPKQKPYMFHAALHYYAQYMSSQMSFQELFRDLQKYLESSEDRWRECIRVKRGVTDTSAKQGQYKDSIYLRGAIKVLKYRKQVDFIRLHSGKITVKDCLKLTQRCLFQNYDRIKTPYFLQDMSKYNQALDRIAQVNFIN